MLNPDKSYIMHQTIENLSIKNEEFIRNNIQNNSIIDCFFEKINLNRSSLVNLRIKGTEFVNCIFQNVDLSFCKFTDCKFLNCDFSLAEIENTFFFKCDFNRTKFCGGRLADNIFTDCDIKYADLTGSSTKFNSFIHTKWSFGFFGNCTIDYNITEDCKFTDTKINVEALGSVFGLRLSDLETVTFLSLGREVKNTLNEICTNTRDYFVQKGLVVEVYVFDVSLLGKNIITCTEELIERLGEKYKKGEYLSPDELKYFFEVLKVLRKECKLPLLVLYSILSFVRKLYECLCTDDIYLEQLLLFYNNITLIYNSMINELNTYNDIIDSDRTCYITIRFKEKPLQNIVQVFYNLHEFVYESKPSLNIKLIKEENGSYIAYLVMGIATLAAFNIGTLLLTGGIKNLVKMRAAFEVLISKRLPKKYYIDVYNSDSSTDLALKILKTVSNINLKNIPDNLKSLSTDGINADNITDISEESDVN